MVCGPAVNREGVSLDDLQRGLTDADLAGDQPGAGSAQFAWLRARLAEVSGPGRDRLVVVFSHHTVASMTNLGRHRCSTRRASS